MFSVGDLVTCGEESGVILRFWEQEGMTESEPEVIAECLWQDGTIEDIDIFCLEYVV